MKQSGNRVKSNVVSLRVSDEEWESLRETMSRLHLDRVSDVMREAFKLLAVSAPSLADAAPAPSLSSLSPASLHFNNSHSNVSQGPFPLDS